MNFEGGGGPRRKQRLAGYLFIHTTRHAARGAGSFLYVSVSSIFAVVVVMVLYFTHLAVKFWSHSVAGKFLESRVRLSATCCLALLTK